MYRWRLKLYLETKIGPINPLSETTSYVSQKCSIQCVVKFTFVHLIQPEPSGLNPSLVYESRDAFGLGLMRS